MRRHFSILEIIVGKWHKNKLGVEINVSTKLSRYFRDERDMLMSDEQSSHGNNYVSTFPHHTMFFTHAPSPNQGGGPERLKFQHHRPSPYHYSQAQRKTSPTDGKKSLHFRCLVVERFFLFVSRFYQSVAQKSIKRNWHLTTNVWFRIDDTFLFFISFPSITFYFHSSRILKQDWSVSIVVNVTVRLVVVLYTHYTG